MLKTLLAEVKQYKKASILTPAFMVGEVVMEILIPMLMAYLIDSGVEKGDVRTICITGGAMAVMAMLSLACGVLSGKYGARASSGFAHNLRQSMFRNIQTFSFSNCCFSERMRKLFRKNEKNVLRFCNKKAKEKRRLQRVKKPM